MALELNQFLTVDELEQRTQDLESQQLENVEIRSVGNSRSGQEIKLISIGAATDRNALIVGVPHPNEPLGSLTVERMIDWALNDPEAQHSGYRWHFIKAIDPDGMRLNHGWLNGDRSIGDLMRHYFRPALQNQPDYTFPLACGDYQFSASTPENLAWQKALELTQPELLASLHHADHGGVFHVISRELPGLTEELQAITATAELGVNPIGDPGAVTPPFAPGIFSLPDIPAIIERSEGRGWWAGDSSASFAEQHYNSFSIVTEVPLWHDPRLLDNSPSGKTLGDVVNAQLAAFTDAYKLLEATLPLVEPLATSGDQQEMLAALQEWRTLTAGFGEELHMAVGKLDLTTELPNNILALRSVLGSVVLRPVGLLTRLVDELSNEDDALMAQGEQARSLFERLLDAFEQSVELEPVALEKLVDIQFRAILATAKALKA